MGVAVNVAVMQMAAEALVVTLHHCFFSPATWNALITELNCLGNLLSSYVFCVPCN
jgi:hypothetical protein